MKKILVALFVSYLTINSIFAYTQIELDSKKEMYTKVILNKIGEKIDALSDIEATKIINIIDVKIHNKHESNSIEGYQLDTLALLLSLKDILTHKISVDIVDASGNDTIVVEAGNVVSVDYTLKLSDGTVKDTSIGKTPFSFTIGQGQVIKGWETGLLGRKVGETFQLVVEPTNGYGIYDDDKTQTVPKSELGQFEDAGIELVVGAVLPTQFGEFSIVGVEGDNVIVDVNHELAGKTLYFDIEIKRIDK